MNNLYALVAWLAVSHAIPLEDKTFVINSEPSKNHFKELVDVSNLCLQPGCVHAASNILEKMDFNVNPCENFYDFACGKYVEETLIPDDQTSMNTFTKMRDDLKEKVRLVLDEPDNEKEIKPFKIVKQLFRTCMNKTVIEKQGAKPLLELLKSLGGMPVLDKDWKEEAFTWFGLVKKFRMMGISVDYVFDFSVSIDISNSTRRRIEFDQPSFRLPREYMVKGRESREVEANLQYMTDLMTLLGADSKTAKKDMLDALDLEISLAKISTPKEKRRNATLLNNPISLKELQLKYNWLEWYGYISAILPPEIAVGEDEIINIQDLQYFGQLGEILQKTPPRVMANWLLGRVASKSVAYLNNIFRKRKLEYITVISGKSEEEPRSKECVDVTLNKLPNLVSALYVRKYFDKQSKQIALEMVEDIKKEFASNLESNEWMDVQTKVEAKKKLDMMGTLIGYPEELDNDTLLADYYKNLEVVENEYLQSSLKLTTFLTDMTYGKLRKPVIKNDWKTWGKAAQVNAFYNRAHNNIRFPAGILQGHFFSPDRPKYLNYAAIGSVIGHEITHGFDDQGRQFDADGNLRDWWKSDTSANFQSRAECIIEQFNNTVDPQTKLNLNGISTQGENIADMGGIQNAYLGYKRFLLRNGVEMQLPGLQQFTPEQLFWITTSQNWCSKYREEAMKLQITRNVHAPSKYRVLLPLKHNKAFADDFKCEANAPMNPVNKCKLW